MKFLAATIVMFWLWKMNAVAVDVVLNGAVTGRTFERLGAVSTGAALQHLKVEIGGELNSTDGTEPTNMRTATGLNLNRVYQWWLLQQAKARNPGLIYFSSGTIPASGHPAYRKMHAASNSIPNTFNLFEIITLKLA
jgi:hypothetical protein